MSWTNGSLHISVLYRATFDCERDVINSYSLSKGYLNIKDKIFVPVL